MKKQIHTMALLKILSLSIVLSLSGKTYAHNQIGQNVILKGPRDSVIVDTMNCQASFPGGVDSMFLYINNNLKYPEEAVKKGKEGKVIFDYTVDTKGKIKNIRIQDDIGLYCK